MATSYKKPDDNIDKLDLHLRYVFEGVNFKERIIVIRGDIDQEKFTFFEGALTELESHSKRMVTVKIFSEGGEVYSALAIVGRMKQAKCKIVTEGFGCVMSAATLILAAGNQRKFSKYGFFMHHESSYELEGRHSDITAKVNQAKIEEERWAEFMATFSKKSKKFYLEKGVHTDAFWSPEELLSFGIIDEIS